MVSQWSCSECGTKKIEVANVCIYEEETGKPRDFCFDCGMKALKHRMLELGQKEIVGGWHFTIPNLIGKQHTAINFLPEVIKY